jgi:hypothetical protein
MNDCCAIHLKTQHFFMGITMAEFTATIQINIARSR